jgi:hypothetical protein
MSECLSINGTAVNGMFLLTMLGTVMAPWKDGLDFGHHESRRAEDSFNAFPSSYLGS